MPVRPRPALRLLRLQRASDRVAATAFTDMARRLLQYMEVFIMLPACPLSFRPGTLTRRLPLITKWVTVFWLYYL